MLNPNVIHKRIFKKHTTNELDTSRNQNLESCAFLKKKCCPFSNVTNRNTLYHVTSIDL